MWYEPEDKYLIEYYNIYRSDDQEGRKFYELIGSTENQLNLPDTTFIDTTQGLSTNSRHWYYVTAVTGDGVESMPSDTVYYTLISKAGELSINNYTEVLEDSIITFKWKIISKDDWPNQYYLRVEQNITANFHPLVYIESVLGHYRERESVDLTIDNFREPVVDEGSYRWRVDCVGSEFYSGSESDWAFFTVNWSNK
ncbi:MAG: hypothetical protein P8X42_07755 [Calditrichaceae bacterium]